jgi:hypothetical protein
MCDVMFIIDFWQYIQCTKKEKIHVPVLGAGMAAVRFLNFPIFFYWCKTLNNAKKVIISLNVLLFCETKRRKFVLS